MLERSLQQHIAQLFTGYRERGTFTVDDARKFLREARHARAKDYVFNFNVPGTTVENTIQTAPKWFFILTNVAVWFDETSGPVYPDIELSFPDGVGSTPFWTSREAAGSVPSKLVFATEGAGRFEPYKNLFYIMGERVSLHVKVTPKNAEKFHGAVLLNGVEVNLAEDY